MDIAFIGLGVMGYPMAGYLSKAGHTVTVYNRTQAKAEKWLTEYKGILATTPAEAAQKAEVVISIVGNDDDVRQVLTGPQGALTTLPKGGLVIDHTTASATLANELAEVCKTKGHNFLDAPVSGGQKGADEGTLTIMVGGEPEVFNYAMPIFSAYGKTITHIGPTGHGQLTKMVNQICIAGAIAGVAEGLSLGTKAGLDMPKVISAASGGSAQSWMLDNRARTMVEGKYDFGFAVDWLRKDLNIAMSQADSMGITLPISHMVDHFLAEVQNMGGNRQDISSLFRRYQKA
ncbi:MAG: NAD-binding protein [Proteobacteria bacterium]|nr:NAD-binding protein [Pseudomonadota bacterium]